MRKETKMTHKELLATVMAEYAAKVEAEEKRREEVRQQALAGTHVPVPTVVWNISDRH